MLLPPFDDFQSIGFILTNIAEMPNVGQQDLQWKSLNPCRQNHSERKKQRRQGHPKAEQGAYMGNKRDALFGRRAFKASKFKSLGNLTISRLTILENRRQVCFKQTRSDVLQLLQLGCRERALLFAVHVVKEHNLLDVYEKIEESLNLCRKGSSH